MARISPRRSGNVWPNKERKLVSKSSWLFKSAAFQPSTAIVTCSGETGSSALPGRGRVESILIVIVLDGDRGSWYPSAWSQRRTKIVTVADLTIPMPGISMEAGCPVNGPERAPGSGVRTVHVGMQGHGYGLPHSARCA